MKSFPLSNLKLQLTPSIYLNKGWMWVFPKIGVPPNHPILIGFSIINHPFWGTTIFGNTHVDLCGCWLKRKPHDKTLWFVFLFVVSTSWLQCSEMFVAGSVRSPPLWRSTSLCGFRGLARKLSRILEHHEFESVSRVWSSILYEYSIIMKRFSITTIIEV